MKYSMKDTVRYRNAAVAADPLGHVREVMLEPALPLGEHLPAPLVSVNCRGFT
jgi:hypothetical protein